MSFRALLLCGERTCTQWCGEKFALSDLVVWLNTVRANYKCGYDLIPKVWMVGSGKNVRFWLDNWFPKSQLQSAFAVCSHQFWHGICKMAWNITTLQQVLPVTVIDSIKSLVPPYHGYIDDSIAWKLTGDGEFDNRSVYPLLQDLEIHYQQRIFPLLWSWKGPARLWVFLWT